MTTAIANMQTCSSHSSNEFGQRRTLRPDLTRDYTSATTTSAKSNETGHQRFDSTLITE